MSSCRYYTYYIQYTCIKKHCTHAHMQTYTHVSPDIGADRTRYYTTNITDRQHAAAVESNFNNFFVYAHIHTHARVCTLIPAASIPRWLHLTTANNVIFF